MVRNQRLVWLLGGVVDRAWCFAAVRVLTSNVDPAVRKVVCFGMPVRYCDLGWLAVQLESASLEVASAQRLSFKEPLASVLQSSALFCAEQGLQFRLAPHTNSWLGGCLVAWPHGGWKRQQLGQNPGDGAKKSLQTIRDSWPPAKSGRPRSLEIEGWVTCAFYGDPLLPSQVVACLFGSGSSTALCVGT